MYIYKAAMAAITARKIYQEPKSARKLLFLRVWGW